MSMPIIPLMERKTKNEKLKIYNAKLKLSFKLCAVIFRFALYLLRCFQCPPDFSINLTALEMFALIMTFPTASDANRELD